MRTHHLSSTAVHDVCCVVLCWCHRKGSLVGDVTHRIGAFLRDSVFVPKPGFTEPTESPANQRSPGISLFGYVRNKVSKQKRRFKQSGFDLDLTYITPRIIAFGFPAEGTEAMYRNTMTDVQRFFRTRHDGQHRIYNLCTERYVIALSHLFAVLSCEVTQCICNLCRSQVV